VRGDGRIRFQRALGAWEWQDTVPARTNQCPSGNTSFSLKPSFPYMDSPGIARQIYEQ